MKARRILAWALLAIGVVGILGAGLGLYVWWEFNVPPFFGGRPYYPGLFQTLAALAASLALALCGWLLLRRTPR